MNAMKKRKLRYAASSAAVTALIIAAIIVFNIIFTSLATKYLWYADMTPELLFTLSDECYDLIENGDPNFENSTSPIEKVNEIREANKAHNAQNGLIAGDADWKDENIKINIIFCNDVDKIEANKSLQYVHKNAMELDAKFDDYFDIKYYNIIRNPSAVTKYLENVETIDPTDVIVEFGTEYRVSNISTFFAYSEDDDDEPWAYNGEKKLAAAILAVTRAESPVACLTVNHNEMSGEGETFKQMYSVLEDAGYIVKTLDLMKEEIPEDCRLMIVCNPQSDFLIADGVSEVDEIRKLEKFLDEANSLMVFMSPNDNKLTNFEEFLDEWGIVFDRYEDASGTLYAKQVEDASTSIATSVGNTTFIANYVTQGLGGEIVSNILSRPTPPKVIFKNAAPIAISSRYDMAHHSDTENGISFDYGRYSSNGTTRDIYNVFVTGEDAYVMSNGVKVGEATAIQPITLMTVTAEPKNVQESNYSTMNDNAYVIACGSVDFLSTALMQSSAYGNSDVLLSISRLIGKEPVPVGLNPKPFGDSTIDVITASDATQYMVVLTIVPAVASLVAGIIVIVRRKNR